MGDRSKIEWTDATWNPVTGCSEISAGCENCYARAMSRRFKRPWKVVCHSHRLEIPARWKKPRKIFVCSMGDLFHKDVPDDFINQVLLVMHKQQQHMFIVLTKRAERMQNFISHVVPGLPSNVWLGVTAENQQTADERIPLLLQTPAAVRFVSFEPLLGPISLERCEAVFGHEKLDWAIIGCESGPQKRPCELEWVRDIKEQCRMARIPPFVKQLNINGKVINDIERFPRDLRIRQ